MTNLETALVFSLKWEGGYSFDKDDPGGETNYGISKRAHPDLDIKNLTMPLVVEIYRKEYWEPAGCDNLDLPLAVCVFDTSVNMGVRKALQFLKETKEPIAYTTLRRNRYYELAKNNPKLNKFLNGWLNRIIDLRKYVEILSTPK